MQPLKDLILKKKQSSRLRRPLEIYELFGQWNEQAAEIYGAAKAQCEPKFLRGKTLYVQINSASLAAELQLRSQALINKLNQHFGRKMVERIVFKF